MADKNMKLLTEDQVIQRLKEMSINQTEMAAKLHCSRAFINQVLTSRRARPPGRMTKLVGVERRIVFVEAGTFPEGFELPELRK